MLVNETWTEVKEIDLGPDEGWDYQTYSLGESGKYEPYTDDTGRLFRSFQKEYGRCTGKVYIDTDKGTKSIGWVFQKRQQYDDCNGSYLMETWVTLYDKPDDVAVTHHYHELN